MTRRRLLASLVPAVLLIVAACGRPPVTRIERVLSGGLVLTLDSAAAPGPAPTAVALAGGRVVALGNADSVARWRAGGAPVTDLGEGVIAPALVDHHVHLYNVGLALLNARSGQRLFLDLSDVRSLAELERRVAARARTAPPGAWVTGAGWSQAAWGTEALPDRGPLDRAVPDRPVFLARGDGHAGWANGRALEAAGIAARSSDPAGGLIRRLPGGAPSGILLERANEAVAALVPQPSDSDVMAAFRLAADSFAASGVVRVYDAGALAVPGVVSLGADFGRMLALLRRTDSIAPLPIEVALMIPAPSRLADSLLAAPAPAWSLSPRIRITHLKLFADGALGSRGAALSHPYADDGATRGVPRMTSAEIADLSRRALAAGLGVATHAIGDLAVRRTLDAYEAILREQPALDPNRLRIEHFSYASEGDFERAVRLGVVLSVQSNFNAGPEDAFSLGDLRVGPAGEDRVYAWDRLYRMGAKLAEGSDYFRRPAGAMAGFLAILTRKHAVGERRADPQARMLAWRLAARWFPPAGPAGDPAIRPGSPGDLVVLSGNPLAGPRAELSGITVIATLRQGRFVARMDR